MKADRIDVRLALCFLFFVVALGLPLLFLGCNTTSYERGEIAALGALVVFDDPDDIEKLDETRRDIVAFLESGESINGFVINRYAQDLAERYQKNPAVIRLVLKKLDAELSLEQGENRAREFLQGIADTLSI
jgi:hypothetical protein